MKCANCNNDSHYVHTIANTYFHFCSKHVPAFLLDRKNAGLLPTTQEWTKDKADATAILSEPIAVKKRAPKKRAE